MTDPALLRAREIAAGLYPNSPWADRTIAGERDSDDAVAAALAAIRDTTARAAELIEGPGGVYALLASALRPPPSALRRGEHLG